MTQYVQRYAASRMGALHPKRGFTMIEAVVSAGLLLGVMSFAVQMTYRVDGVWRDAAQHRVAIHELANHLDQLTSLADPELAQAIEVIQVSEAAKRTLHDAKLNVERTEDDLGPRIVLRINWTRRVPGQPVMLAGWARPTTPDRAPNTNGTPPPEDSSPPDDSQTTDNQETLDPPGATP